MPFTNSGHSELLHDLACQFEYYLIPDISSRMHCCNLEKKYASESDHGVNVVWDANESISDIGVSQKHLHNRYSCRNGGFGTLLEMTRNGCASKTSEDVGIEVKLGEMMV